MVPPDSHRISRVPRYSGYRWASARIRVRGFHPLRPSFPDGSTSVLSCRVPVLQPQTCRNKVGLGYSAFARHYWRNHYCFLLLRVLRCFSSPRLPSDEIGIIHSSRIRLPHSEIRGSIRICQSPRLIAAYHVLHRLPEPRHPPCALNLLYFLNYCAVCTDFF